MWTVCVMDRRGFAPHPSRLHLHCSESNGGYIAVNRSGLLRLTLDERGMGYPFFALKVTWGQSGQLIARICVHMKMGEVFVPISRCISAVQISVKSVDRLDSPSLIYTLSL